MIQSWLPANIAGEPDGAQVGARGVLSEVGIHRTAQGRNWAQAVLSTGDGAVRVWLYPLPFAEFADLFVDGAEVTVVGVLDRRSETPFVMVKEVAR